MLEKSVNFEKDGEENLLKKCKKKISEISQKCEEQVKIEAELESVEQLVKKLGKERKTEKKHAREELVVESTHIHQINEMIEKLSKEVRFKQNEYDYVVGNYKKMRPYYFNTGCCCFSDGDITGIEIAEGFIRLIKWEQEGKHINRIVLEEAPLDYLFDQL